MNSELQAKRAATIRLIPIGLALGLGMVGLLYSLVPPLRDVDTLADRMVVALRCAGVAALTLFAGIQAVAGQRGKSEAIDPLAGAGREPRVMQIHARYTQNTLEQLVLFVIVLGALSTYLDAGSMHLLPILTAVFILGRVVFWVGYLRDPLLRSPGMAIAFMINGVSLVYIVYRTLRSLVGV
ncbi:MAPEG family protein [Nannocystis punicea]|uniref:MAPEG family protein n=1 Tax=Nannocystis punicea TaxID=2995304 RepID=A0ABY7H8F0_9BACT|nr:MAPEG family protein [Nannocystis poenicansa]WAS95543.1 MAPEG family protein [Nannocystis poenicansa]